LTIESIYPTPLVGWKKWLEYNGSIPILKRYDAKKCRSLVKPLGAVMAVRINVYNPNNYPPLYIDVRIAFSPRDINGLLLLRQLDNYELYALNRLCLIPYVPGGVY